MVTFSTLKPTAVAEASAVYHMVRNVGSSIHISLSITLAVRMSRTSYAELAPAVSPANEALTMPWVTGGWNVHDPAGLAALGREVARQAAMIGYLDAFGFFIATALAVLPLVLLIRWKR
jgi:DHA2 family multidrug resistance protein